MDISKKNLDISKLSLARCRLTFHSTHHAIDVESRYSPLSSLERVLFMFKEDEPSSEAAAAMLEALDECEDQRKKSVGGGGSGGGRTSAKGGVVSKVRQRLEGLLGGQLHP